MLYLFFLDLKQESQLWVETKRLNGKSTSEGFPVYYFMRKECVPKTQAAYVL